MIRRLQYLNVIIVVVVFLCWIGLAVYDPDPSAMPWLIVITALGALSVNWLRRQAAKHDKES